MQNRIFVDTNIFLRFLTKDDEKKAKKCYELFKKVEGRKIVLETTQAVLAEVVYILSSKSLYNLEHERIKEILMPIINLPGLKVESKKIFIDALDIYAQNELDFEDCLTISQMRSQRIEVIYSYDRDFDMIAGIERIEP